EGAGEGVRADGECARVVVDVRPTHHRGDGRATVERDADRRGDLVRDERDGARRGDGRAVRRGRGHDLRGGVVDTDAGDHVLGRIAETVEHGGAQVVDAVGELGRVVRNAPRRCHVGTEGR